MKTFFALLLAAVLSVVAHGAVTWTHVTETEFLGVNTTSKLFNAEMIEQGNAQQNPALYELGIGDGNWQSPATVGHYVWVANNYHTFRIAVDSAGNGTIALDGIVQLTDQPLGAISEVWLGNRNGAGVPFQQVWLRDMTFNGFDLPDIDTAGPESFGGLRITGFESQEWTLEGKIMWRSDDGTSEGTIAHWSRVSVFGSETTIPEPTSSVLIMCSSLLLLKRSRRRRRAFFILICRIYALSHPTDIGCSRSRQTGPV